MEQDRYDVTILGGGIAGSAAGVFTARAGLDTLIVEDEKSLLQKCAFLENYLGFPFGIKPRCFLEMMRDHTAQVGCERVIEELDIVTKPDQKEGDTEDSGARFEVRFGENTVRSASLVVASWSRSDYLEINVETVTEEPNIDILVTDDEGRTTTDGVYAAGRITGERHQAIVNAGSGANAGLTLVEDANPDFYNDWVVPEGYYESYEMDVPVGVEEIGHEERRRRIEQSQKTRAYFTDDQ